MGEVNWGAYAREYDAIVGDSPAYRDMVEDCRATVRGWVLPAGAMVADLGGGTGNFSVPVAADNPGVRVLHVENNAAMAAVAGAKAARAGVRNWSLVPHDIETALDALPPLDAVITVNVLYVLPRPGEVIDRVASKLKPGGTWFACDLGRPMHPISWGLYLVAHSVRGRGVAATLRNLRHSF